MRRKLADGSQQVPRAGVSAGQPSRELADRVSVVDLRVNGRSFAMAVDTARPRLSWRLESDRRGTLQSAYRIRVASSEQALQRGDADLWESGKVTARHSLGIAYAGRELTSRQRCWWNVQIWDERGISSETSLPAWWEMGLLGDGDWVAEWLAVEDKVSRENREVGLRWIWGKGTPDQPVHRFRFSFDLAEPAPAGELIAAVKQTMLFSQITRVWLDGVPIAGPGRWIEWKGGMLDAPPETSIGNLVSQRVTLRDLAPGRHILAVEVGTRPVSVFRFATDNAPENVPGLAALLRLELAHGKSIRLTTGGHWTANADRDVDGWQLPGFDDTDWPAAISNVTEPHQPWPAQPAMHLRTSFEVEKSISSARLYVTALGVYEARLNGEKIGDEILAPGPSQYDKRLFYQTHDVRAMLRPGRNAIGFTVADGWYAAFDGRFAWGSPPRRLLAQLELTYEDGSQQVVTTRPGWRIAESGVRSSELKIGEIHDNRLEPLGWDDPSYDDSQWEIAAVGAPHPGALRAQNVPPIRIKKRLSPIAVTKTANGDYLIDFGECFAGWCELPASGNPGDRIEVNYGERLTPAGDVDQAIMSQDPTGQPRRDIFFLRGDIGQERLASRFVYRGLRYAQVRGLKSPPDTSLIEGVFIHTDLEEVGSIHSETRLPADICNLTLQTLKSTFVGVPVDNNVREVRGYHREAAIFGEAAAYLMDVRVFFPNHLESVTDAQADDGTCPLYAPLPQFAKVMPKPPGQSPGTEGDPLIFLVWLCWRQYGDANLVHANWEAMRRYAQFVLSHNPTYLWLNKRAMNIGEWLDLEPTPVDLFATAVWARSTTLMAQMAEVIGQPEEAAHFRLLRANIEQAFNAAFVGADGTIGNGSQCGYVLSLAYGLLDAELSGKGAGHLAHAIRSRSPQGLTTGTWSTALLLDVLADNGHAALAYELLTSTSFPSWGHMLRHGATAVWEHWDGVAGAQNQPAFSSVAGFIFRRIAGIAPAAPGFEAIEVRPLVDRRHSSAGASYNSIMGRISTDWCQSGDGEFLLRVEIPANTTAKVTFPASDAAEIREGGESLCDRNDMRLVDRSDREATIEIGSGSYRFTARSREHDRAARSASTRKSR